MVMGQKEMKKKIVLDPTWHSRRIVIHLTLLACLLESVYALYKGPELTSVSFPWLVGLAGSVVGSYVFGSSWERVNGVPSFSSYQPSWPQQQPISMQTLTKQEQIKYQVPSLMEPYE